MKDKATPCRERMVLLHDRMQRLWTVERCNLRQIKMDTSEKACQKPAGNSRRLKKKKKDVACMTLPKRIKV